MQNKKSRLTCEHVDSCDGLYFFLFTFNETNICSSFLYICSYSENVSIFVRCIIHSCSINGWPLARYLSNIPVCGTCQCFTFDRFNVWRWFVRELQILRFNSVMCLLYKSKHIVSRSKDSYSVEELQNFKFVSKIFRHFLLFLTWRWSINAEQQ